VQTPDDLVQSKLKRHKKTAKKKETEVDDWLMRGRCDDVNVAPDDDV